MDRLVFTVDCTRPSSMEPGVRRGKFQTAFRKWLNASVLRKNRMVRFALPTHTFAIHKQLLNSLVGSRRQAIAKRPYSPSLPRCICIDPAPLHCNRDSRATFRFLITCYISSPGLGPQRVRASVDFRNCCNAKQLKHHFRAEDTTSGINS